MTQTVSLGLNGSLTPFRRRGAGTTGLIRSVSQASFQVRNATAFATTVREAVSWMRNRNSAIPHEAFQASPFDVGGGGTHPARAVTLVIDDGRVWAASLDFPDATTVGRTWVTEITVAEQAGRVHFGARLINVTRAEDTPFVPSLPGVARQVISRITALADGVQLEETAIRVTDADAVDDMIALLDDPTRTLPVVVMTDGVDWRAVANATVLAGKLAGAAHCFSLNQVAWREFGARFGRLLSVFGGGARIYWPGFNAENSDPFEHPLWVAKPVFRDRTDEIIVAVLAASITRGARAEYPRFDAIRQAAAAETIASERATTSDAGLIQLFEAENLRLEAELGKARQEMDQWMVEMDAERSDLARTLAETKSDAARYRAQAEVFRAALSGGVAIVREPLSEFAGFEDWASRNLSPNLWFANKATKEMEKNGQFDTPALIGDALYMLDDLFVPMKREPSDDRRAAYLARLESLGCTDQPCFTDRNAIRGYPAYAATYRGEKVWCEHHIKYGGGVDPKRMFRIYYHWHEDDQLLIIGHIPSHLDNSLTN